MYIYGGYIITGGFLDDAHTKPWQGVRLLLAELREGQSIPITALSVKGVYSDSMIGTLAGLPIGVKVTINCDLRQRVTDITPVKG